MMLAACHPEPARARLPVPTYFDAFGQTGNYFTSRARAVIAQEEPCGEPGIYGQNEKTQPTLKRYLYRT
jgi:hypothetical protein